ncbi:MAG: GTP 3',8-cyclase MoaA [Gemmatimonadota bacterium]|nr:MAG: GTP 3',8-cyclase MoaA [Gemmatimonadota bacterium]
MTKTSGDGLPRDTLDRPLGSLRISVTDRCNIRCRYCMPEDEYVWLPRESILSFEEAARLARVFSGLGVARVRITGGEPLLRHDLTRLIQLLSDNPALTDISLTTNGILLAKYADQLKAAGLSRVTVSLDTLRPDRFTRFTRSRRFQDVLAGIDAAGAAGFAGTKINTVVVRDENDDELVDLLEYAKGWGAEVRFIEYMDVGGATQWSRESVVTKDEILGLLAEHYGAATAVGVGDASELPAPADRFRLPDGTVFGIIASTTNPFCRTCDRSRITADGVWFQCLYAESGVDLKQPLRAGASDEELAAQISRSWTVRDDRGAEQRLQLVDRGALYQRDRLRSDPHREMHTRGG